MNAFQSRTARPGTARQRKAAFSPLPQDPDDKAVYELVFFSLKGPARESARLICEQETRAGSRLTADFLKLRLVKDKDQYTAAGPKGPTRRAWVLHYVFRPHEVPYAPQSEFPQRLGQSLDKIEVINALYYCGMQIASMFDAFDSRWEVPEGCGSRKMNSKEKAEAKVVALDKLVRMIELADDSLKLDVVLVACETARMLSGIRVYDLNDILGQCLSRMESAEQANPGTGYEALLARLRWAGNVCNRRHQYD